MKMTKKAQTATEYLIILAVVIVIALVVASLLGGFPGIGSSIKGNANQGYWATTDIVVAGATVNTDGTATLKIRNNMPETIKITYSVLENATNGTDVTLKAGDSANIDFDGLGTPSGSYSYDISFDYTDELGANYTFSGDRPLEGSVSN